MKVQNLIFFLKKRIIHSTYMAAICEPDKANQKL